MAKKKASNPFAGMGSMTAKSKEVNPTFSSPGGGVTTAKPATKKNVQLNPTYSRSAGETSKGKTGSALAARKSKVGAAPFSMKSGLATGKLIRKSNSGGSNVKGLATPKRNEEGKQQGVGPMSRYDEENVNKAPATPKMTKGNFKGTATRGKAKKKASISTPSSASKGNFAGTRGNGQVTVSRLKKLGF
jgi:hypothetical protein